MLNLAKFVKTQANTAPRGLVSTPRVFAQVTGRKLDPRELRENGLSATGENL